MDKLRKMVAVLTLSAIVLAFAAPALAQIQDKPMASPAMTPGRMQDGMKGGMTMPVEQSDKDMMATLMGTNDTGMAASIMRTAGLEGVTMPGGTYTLFVASDAALKATSPDVMNTMKEKLKDRQMATDFVKGHLVSGMITPDGMTDGKTLTMINGDTITVRTTGGRLTVDDATIVKAVRTSNGMIYVMDRIPSSVMAIIERMSMMPVSTGPVSM